MVPSDRRARRYPAILIHGGPGVPSFYLKPLEALGDERQIVRYDQLGGGKSDRTSDTANFNIAHFVAEPDSLRSHLGFQKVHLIGHAWGALVAVEYYRAHPDHVASMVLASPMIDLPAWARSTARLVKTLPDSDQRAIRESEAAGRFDSPAYRRAFVDFAARYMWLRPRASDKDSVHKSLNDSVYVYMEGPSDFTITGTLKNYDAKPFLRTVHVPVLYTVGDHDEADTAAVRRLASITPHAKLAIIPHAAHVTMWDNSTEMIAQVRHFSRPPTARRITDGGERAACQPRVSRVSAAS